MGPVLGISIWGGATGANDFVIVASAPQALEGVSWRIFTGARSACVASTEPLNAIAGDGKYDPPLIW